MKKLTKRTKEWEKLVDKDKKISLTQAIDLAKKLAVSKFNEALDIAIMLGIDPRRGEQNVRGSCSLPHGSGKSERILVFAKGEKEGEAKEAGADYVGGADLSDKIKGGWLDFERVVATPDMMREVGKIGKILGPRGLMPNPKLGTVTFDVKNAITEIKKGKVEFRSDKSANLHVTCGKADFLAEHLVDNVKAIIDAVIKLKPSSAKGVYIKSIFLSTTMGPGIRVDESSLIK
ncbi:MAG: 50S ribosomal protein L1 [SAR324 cluster bacterium]|nr:50S ribosomal protein L1 [SAR324 cluster bacterium]